MPLLQKLGLLQLLEMLLDWKILEIAEQIEGYLVIFIEIAFKSEDADFRTINA